MMLNTFSVDLEGITSSVSRSQFDESELEYLANLFLQSGDTVNPLLLRQNTPLTFEVLEGHREYYAALKAQELNPKFESIRAYIVPSDRESSILEQYEFFNSSPAVTQAVNSEIDQKLLVSAIERSISTQINPLKSSLKDVSLKLDQKIVSFEASMSKQSTVSAETSLPNSVQQQLAELTQSIKNLEQRFPPPPPVSNMLEDLNNLSKDDLKKKLEKVGIKGVLVKSIVDSIANGRDTQPYESFKDIISRKNSSGKKKMFTDAGLIKLLEIKVLDIW